MRIDIRVSPKPNGKTMASNFFKSFDRPYVFSKTICGNDFPFSSYNGQTLLGRVKDVTDKNGAQQLELETEMAEDDLRNRLRGQGWKEDPSPAT